jgi:hypothetical protein
MTVDELKREVEAYREKLKENTGIVKSSEHGPVGMAMIDALVAAIEHQQRQIDDLQKQGTRTMR